ncbi:hypothetical protein AB0395_32350 [Streptosporangium sp. NPDC051023]|uniref:hypothetical protein n=1 Tax=Streptosporangium sp. NPDC051023 TaxID=3155410 RepID=UPI00344EF269
MLGSWPVADEDKFYASGQRWITFATTMSRNASAADTYVAQTTSRNDGDDIKAFDQDWQDTLNRMTRGLRFSSAGRPSGPTRTLTCPSAAWPLP